jgi:ABC-2 type transport system permease protein
MVAWEKRKTGDLLLLLNGIVLAIVLNQVAALYFFRIDLTEEGRYTMKKPTLELLQGLDDDVYIEVYLEGDLNAEFRRLRKAVRETLEEFRVGSKNRVHYQFSDPQQAAGQGAKEFMADLVARGIKPINIIDSKDGRRSEKIVFPGALISYGGLQTPVMLLTDQVGGAQQDINRAIEGLEYGFSSSILRLTITDHKRIGFVSGHGELDSIAVSSLRDGLLELYDVNLNVSLNQRLGLPDYDVLLIAKPTERFTEAEKYYLDQYIMGGGSAVFMMDALRVNMDSLSSGDYYAFPYDINLDDQLFHYGVRLNPDLVLDLVSLRYPVVTGQVNGNPQVTAIEWPYFPLANTYASHSVTRNLDATALRFAGSLDSVKAAGIKKTPLMFTSAYSRKLIAPVKVNVNDLRKEITPQNFSTPNVPVAYLLEGKFTSLFARRFVPDGVNAEGNRSNGEFARIVVIADGDVARNEVSRRTGQPLDLGFDAVTNHTFANRELLLNLIAYLTDDSGLITTRNKEIPVRPLDREKVREGRVFWQSFNLIVPVILVVAVGILKAWLRRKKYGMHSTPSHG